MHTFYFIPGLGADERLFSRLKLEEYDKRFIRWIAPLENETLPDYAVRLSAQVDVKNKFSLIGASFGGMIAVELSRRLHPENLILISSIKTREEIPWNLRFFEYIPVYLFCSEAFIQRFAQLNMHRFGIYKEEEQKLFTDMLLACPAGYLKGAIHMILHWKNKKFPDTTLHIHGEMDRLFPIRRIRNPLRIKDGTHFMPYHKAEEIEKIIRDKIEK